MRMPTISRGQAVGYLALAGALLTLGGHFLVSEQVTGSSPRPPRGALAPLAEPSAIERPRLVVHVVGAVRRPGVYRLVEGSRVQDAVRRAGGAKRRADTDLLNLASVLLDGQQVVVPLRSVQGQGVGSDPVGGGAGGSGNVLPVSGTVHLNTATLAELDSLPGVGPVTAQRIIDYRTSQGGFGSIDELDAVPGIGPARLEQLRELVGL